ncbi:MAG: hypothetical protein NVSMB42_11890 [Herpetosiphon sp.]
MKGWIALLFLVILGSCTFQPAPQVYVTEATVAALTPETLPASTATVTETPSATASPSATTLPTASATPTSQRATADTATSTVLPQMADFGWCMQQWGPADSARFSARLQSLEVRRLSDRDQLTLIFRGLKGQLHGQAGCLRRVQWEHVTGKASLEDTMLMLSLPDWAHDDQATASPITATVPITVPSVMSGVTFVPVPAASRGFTIGIGLREAHPFHVQVASGPDRLVVEVRRDGKITDAADPLGQVKDAPDLADTSLFFLQNFDVWRWYHGQAAPVLKTPELEYALAVSPDRETLALCRAPAGSNPSELPLNIRGSLWLLKADGSEARQVADVGGCSDPVFAPNGKTIAFTGNLATVPPARPSIWTVPVVVGEPTLAVPAGDEWTRMAPQWLADGRLVYRGEDQSGQSVLFLREADGHERELSSSLLTGSEYRGVGTFQVNKEDNTLALEALRADKEGADLVLLHLDGTRAGADTRGFWQRPLVWTAEGLLYLTTECPSGIVQQYTLRLRHGTTSDDLLHGTSAGAIGDAVIAATGVFYTRVAEPAEQFRGPRATSAPNSSVSIWWIDASGQHRREVYRAPVPISDLQGR